MSGVESQEASQAPAIGAGARLAAARRQQGLHIAALAAQLKVPQARLEALEAERWDQLPDATHARALATSVCRVLGLDPTLVLATMPRGAGAALERVTAGLNQPVRDGAGWTLPRGVWWLGAVALLLVAAALALWPRQGGWAELLPQIGAENTAQPPADLPSAAAAPLPVTEASASVMPLQPANDASVPAAASHAQLAAPASAASRLTSAQGVSLSQAGAPASAALAAASFPAAAATGAMLEVRASQGASWISVVDAQGVSLASRLLQQGEVLALEQTRPPLRVVLGNAPALTLRWRGQGQALDAYAQTRVARLELK